MMSNDTSERPPNPEPPPATVYVLVEDLRSTDALQLLSSVLCWDEEKVVSTPHGDSSFFSGSVLALLCIHGCCHWAASTLCSQSLVSWPTLTWKISSH
ncbi:uncharacterized protein LOC123024130 isoform X1 [Varanus komodoensis]|uniref:uncharacterized protein LOC123024130 isoform X1 n=1 Tax=Varanus komodoensis TaxID=61221 RepID=UPI001CF7ADDA|nr:uncharacterized protein LOC123024130 isoform X1 [Varanus komodoensis]